MINKTMKLLTRKNTQKTNKTQSKYFKFTLSFAFITSIPLLTVGLFNVIIDPYNAYDSPILLGINQEKPKKENNDRLFKALDIIRKKPEIIILGSSRTKQGINPENPVFNNSKSVYNLAINGPNTYEVRRYLEHAIYNNKDLKLVILGIDFFMFNKTLANQPSFSENRLNKSHIDITDLLNTTVSLDTLDSSIKTITASKEAKITNINQVKNHGKNGFLPNRNINDGKTKARFDGSIKLYFELHSDYQFSEAYFQDFEKIVNLCKENNIELKVFISPAHSTDNEAIRVTQQWQVLEDWKRKMVQLTPVWDFSGYNSITTEKIADKMTNYADNSHFTPRVGDLILDRIFNQKTDSIPDDFGILITPENIESHLAKIRKDREIWAENNPDEIQLVKKIYPQVLEQKKLTKSKINE
jgi:hypothetical protein